VDEHIGLTEWRKLYQRMGKSYHTLYLLQVRFREGKEKGELKLCGKREGIQQGRTKMLVERLVQNGKKET